jgi:hypothetical protein
MVAVTAVVTSVSEVPSAPIPAAVDQATVVEIPDDDTLPPGWGQWESWPVPALEPAAGVLVMREDGCVMSRQPTHGADASSSRASLPASNTTVAHLEQDPPVRRRPTSTKPRPSRRCGKSFETTGPRSTTC